MVKAVHDTSGPTNGRLTKIFLCDLAGHSMKELVSPCNLLLAIKITSRSSTWWGGQHHVIMTSQTAETFEFLPRVASRGKHDIQLAFDLKSWRDSMSSFQACKVAKDSENPTAWWLVPTPRPGLWIRACKWGGIELPPCLHYTSQTIHIEKGIIDPMLGVILSAYDRQDHPELSWNFWAMFAGKRPKNKLIDL